MSGCSSEITPPGANGESDPDLFFVRGYRTDKDPCKLTGETEFTNRFLDDSADLVTCPSGHEAAEELLRTTRAVVVAQTKSYTLYRIPRR
jgi:hypothetical protein